MDRRVEKRLLYMAGKEKRLEMGDEIPGGGICTSDIFATRALSSTQSVLGAANSLELKREFACFAVLFF